MFCQWCTREGDKVRAVFQSACPRNNVRLEGTFLTVERQDPEDSDKWELVCGPAQCTAPPQYALESQRCT